MAATRCPGVLVVVQGKEQHLLGVQVQGVKDEGQLLEIHQLEALCHLGSDEAYSRVLVLVKLTIFTIESDYSVIEPLITPQDGQVRQS